VGSDGREQVSQARRASQAGASNAGRSGEAECGARHPSRQTNGLVEALLFHIWCYGFT
jgi:hypothetical protein